MTLCKTSFCLKSEGINSTVSTRSRTTNPVLAGWPLTLTFRAPRDVCALPFSSLSVVPPSSAGNPLSFVIRTARYPLSTWPAGSQPRRNLPFQGSADRPPRRRRGRAARRRINAWVRDRRHDIVAGGLLCQKSLSIARIIIYSQTVVTTGGVIAIHTVLWNVASQG